MSLTYKCACVGTEYSLSKVWKYIQTENVSVKDFVWMLFVACLCILYQYVMHVFVVLYMEGDNVNEVVLVSAL